MTPCLRAGRQGALSNSRDFHLGKKACSKGTFPSGNDLTRRCHTCAFAMPTNSTESRASFHFHVHGRWFKAAREVYEGSKCKAL